MEDREIFETQDGSHSVFSQKFGVSYHSKYGAVQESRHVFIEAGLFPKILGKRTLAVLEIGFGTGLNAFLTFLEAESRQLEIRYEAIEAYPLSMEQVRQLNYPAMLHAENYADQFLRMHQCQWSMPAVLSENFQFKKELQRFEDIDYEKKFDLIYFDAFAPNAQPELWEPEVLSKMYKALKKGGVLVTYCAKGVVKRRLTALGFTVEAIKGPPGKREMTRCMKGI